MAGHSKWANIQFRKGAQDKKRAKIFTRLIREISVAAREGINPDNNPRLRMAIERGQAANMPKSAITRAIERGSGAQGGEGFEDVLYEGYAGGGVAVLIESSTDNRNRSIADIRHAFTKHNSTMADVGSVSYLFKQVGEVVFNGKQPAAEAIFEIAAEVGADDVLLDDDRLKILIEPAKLGALTRALDAAGFKPNSVDTVRLPEVTVKVDDEQRQKLALLIDALEELDDVQSVYTNLEV